MLGLIFGLSLFFSLHLLREIGLRQTLSERLGASPYKALVSICVLISLYLIIEGKSAAPFIQVWVPPFGLRSLTHALMISACILVLAGNLPNSYTKQWLVHPVLAGVIIWGCSHLLANGDLASILLFGSFSLWAMIKIISLQRQHGATENTAPPTLTWDAAAIILGMIAYSLLFVFHGPLFGFALMALA